MQHETHQIEALFEPEPTEYEQKKLSKKLKIIRNEFQTTGKYGMPVIKKQEIDLDKIDLLSYTKLKDTENKTIHFFTYDWLFESVYNKPEEAAEKLKNHYAILSPDFSVYTDMPIALQIYSTFKNRRCGAYWQNLGFKVIPTVEWGDERSFEFCFDGVEQGSVVAVSTYGRKNQEGFLLGYNKMLGVIQPSTIICYGEPFKGMKGNIKVISPYDYKEIASKIGTEKTLEKYLEGDLYPS